MAVETAWTASLAVASFATLLLAAGGPRPCAAAQSSASDEYRTLLDVVTTIVDQDVYWAQAFNQSVYYPVERGSYAYFVDKELLEGATDVPETAVAATPAAGDAAAKPAAGNAAAAKPAAGNAAADAGGGNKDRGDAIRPMAFVRNVMRRRFRVGTVLGMAVDVLHRSLMCVAYKHGVHLIHLISTELKRSKTQNKAISWSGKAMTAVAGVIIKMAALRRVDGNLLRTAAILDAFGDKTEGAEIRRDTADMEPALEHLSRTMLDYIGTSCVLAPVDAKAVANEMRFLVTPLLFTPARASAIEAGKYKEMVNSILSKMSQLYDALPSTVGMSLDRWNDLLHFKRDTGKSKQRELLRLSRH